jgi:hypothetical protein
MISLRSPASPRSRLRIYLNDHLAAASAGIELSRRALRNNRATPLGDFLQQFLDDIIEDRNTLAAVLRRLGEPQNRVKQTAAVIAERAGRLKPNGQLLGYSDLSRLVELEALCAGVEAKICLWRSLERVSGAGNLIPGVDVRRMIERGEAQRLVLESHRLEAAQRALR